MFLMAKAAVVHKRCCLCVKKCNFCRRLIPLQSLHSGTQSECSLILKVKPNFVHCSCMHTCFSVFQQAELLAEFVKKQHFSNMEKASKTKACI